MIHKYRVEQVVLENIVVFLRSKYNIDKTENLSDSQKLNLISKYEVISKLQSILFELDHTEDTEYKDVYSTLLYVSGEDE